MGDYAAMNEAYLRFFSDPLPARTLITTPGSRGPVSFDAIAYRPDPA
jgi:enamine deaminase RidA (YjgF/YER057c/UK114 family)